MKLNGWGPFFSEAPFKAVYLILYSLFCILFLKEDPNIVKFQVFQNLDLTLWKNTFYQMLIFTWNSKIAEVGLILIISGEDQVKSWVNKWSFSLFRIWND